MQSLLGSRKGHDILDNHQGKGLTILLGDQHLPALVTCESGLCIVTMRYSNTTLSELHKFMMMPLVKNPGTFKSKDRGGFSEVVQQAVDMGLNITLVVSSGTSWVNDGPSGYTESMQVIYDWSQAYTFKTKTKEKKPKSLFSCVLFPQPMLPYIKPHEAELQTRTYLTQHSVEATNLARMLVGANSHKSLKSGQSETDLVGMSTSNRSIHDRLYDCVPFSFRPQIKSGGNPAHDRMPVKLRLKDKINWFSSERSDPEQRLSVKFLINWCHALLTDLATHASAEVVTKEELLQMRAQYPNVLVDEEKWDAQIEAQRAADKGPNAYCVHPSVHADTLRGSVKAMTKHKLECWSTGKTN